MSIILENARDVQDKSKSGSGGSTFILNNLESGSQVTLLANAGQVLSQAPTPSTANNTLTFSMSESEPAQTLHLSMGGQGGTGDVHIGKLDASNLASLHITQDTTGHAKLSVLDMQPDLEVFLSGGKAGSQFTVNYLESVHLDASELLSDLSLRVRTPEGDFPPYTALVKGGHGNDNLGTYSAAVHFDGGAGNDVLTGNKGDDILQGGAGDDVLTGGAGKDIFFFGSLPADSGEHSADALIGAIGTDEITDFSTADGDVAQLWYDEKIGYTNADGGIVLIATLTNFKDLANLTGDNFA